MATIKSFTSLEQSKKLAEILPLESADMIWANDNDVIVVPYDMTTRENVLHDFIPCWSLAALLDILPKVINNETLFIETSPALWHIGYRNIYTARADNPVDACVAMVIKLHELNLL